MTVYGKWGHGNYLCHSTAGNQKCRDKGMVQYVCVYHDVWAICKKKFR